MKTNNLYEDSPLRQVTGKALRPGGVELTRHGLDLCGFSRNHRILDLGCGAGASLELLHALELNATGLDLSTVLLREASDHAPVVAADMAELPFADGRFEGVVCECALSLADDPSMVLAECRRVLTPSGRLLLSDLIRRSGSFPRLPDGGPEKIRGRDSDPGCFQAPCARGALPVESLAALLEEQGFSILRLEDHTRLLRDLAARIIWHFCSLAAFGELWSRALIDDNSHTAGVWKGTPVPACDDGNASRLDLCGGLQTKNTSSTASSCPSVRESGACSCPPDGNPGKNLGYVLIIAVKKETP